MTLHILARNVITIGNQSTHFNLDALLGISHDYTYLSLPLAKKYVHIAEIEGVLFCSVIQSDVANPTLVDLTFCLERICSVLDQC